MDWKSARRYYGLQHPFDFGVALPFLLNVFVFIFTFAISILLLAKGALIIGSERFYFFAYILTLLLVAAAFSRTRGMSLAIATWCAIELALGFFGSGLLPLNVVRHPDYRYVHHPLLQRALAPNEQYKIRFDSRNKAFFDGWLVNWSALDGLEVTLTHNSLGLRGRELTSADLKKELIFVYGGSTTYDGLATQGATWVEQLQFELNDRYTIVNFGVPAHSTVEHLIDTVFYQKVLGNFPACAMYYIGWNDISTAHVKNLDPAYVNHHSLEMVVRRPEFWAAKYSPLVRLAYRNARKRFDSIPDASPVYGSPPISGNDAQLERFFTEHVTTIANINNARGIRTVFIGQMLNRDLLNADPLGVTFPFPLTRRGEVWSLQERFNSILRSTALTVGAHYIDAGVENFSNADFADWGHFLPSGSSKFANLIAGEVNDYCARAPANQ